MGDQSAPSKGGWGPPTKGKWGQRSSWGERIEGFTGWRHVEPAFMANVRHQPKPLFELSQATIVTELTHEKIFSNIRLFTKIMLLARLHFADKVADECYHFVQKNAKELFSNSDFQRLQEDAPEFWEKMLKCRCSVASDPPIYVRDWRHYEQCMGEELIKLNPKTCTCWEEVKGKTLLQIMGEEWSARKQKEMKEKEVELKKMKRKRESESAKKENA